MEHLEGVGSQGRESGWSQKLLWGSFEDCWIWGRTIGTGWSPSLPNPRSAPLPWMLLLWANHTWGHTTHLCRRQHWLCYPGTTLSSSLQFHPLCISSLKIWQAPRCSDQTEHTHTPSRVSASPTASCTALKPEASAPTHWKWGRVPRQKVQSNQQSLLSASQLLLWLSVAAVPWAMYIHCLWSSQTS